SFATFSMSIAVCAVDASDCELGLGFDGAAPGIVRVDAAICDAGAAVISVSSASDRSLAGPPLERSSNMRRAAASNHDGISASFPPKRPRGRAGRPSSGAAVGARGTAPARDGPPLLDDEPSTGSVGATAGATYEPSASPARADRPASPGRDSTYSGSANAA